MSAQNKFNNNCIDSLSKINNYLYTLDDEIINGVFYTFPDKRIKGNPFIIDKTPTQGFIFNSGNTYNQFLINYDLISDKLIIKVENFHGSERFIAVNKNQVDSFLMGNTLFVNSRYIARNKNKRNYYEQIYGSGNISLYKSYEKRFIDMYDEFSYPYGKFSEIETKLFLVKDRELININSANAFIKCFGKEHRKEVQKYIHKHNIQLKKASNDVLNEMMSYCNMLISR
jgi:hypothetical protein